MPARPHADGTAECPARSPRAGWARSAARARARFRAAIARSSRAAPRRKVSALAVGVSLHAQAIHTLDEARDHIGRPLVRVVLTPRVRDRLEVEALPGD